MSVPVLFVLNYKYIPMYSAPALAYKHFVELSATFTPFLLALQTILRSFNGSSY